MALPNYSPQGTILFGSVPWNNQYRHVRLYSTLEEQYADIASMMLRTSDNYVYIGRNRRLKVDIEADKLYHMNYCMYRNDSLTDGYIYCFITDVEYINDHTSEITLETDIFQTFLMGTDWTMPPCFIERETVPSESSRYLLTQEPGFDLVYQITADSRKMFRCNGVVFMTATEVSEEKATRIPYLNEEGYYAGPSQAQLYKGVVQGCSYYFIPITYDASGQADISKVQNFLTKIIKAGATDSIVSIFVVPEYAGTHAEGWLRGPQKQDDYGDYVDQLQAPSLGNTVGSYAPKNRKLMYYPYTYLKVTDYNGNTSELRYELMGDDKLDIFYSINAACKALVAPHTYMNAHDVLDAGVVVDCGAPCSWNSHTFQTWLAQNAMNIALGAGAVALAGVSGGASLATAAALLGESAVLANAGFSAFSEVARQDAMSNGRTALSRGGAAAGGAAAGIAQIYGQSKQPSTLRGSVSSDVMFMSGLQGVHALKIQLNEDIASQIDQFFSQFGYAVNRIESVNVTSRDWWNYVKTSSCSPRSYNANSGNTAPFSRGRGTPADALAVIQRCFDNGITFWHTTTSFGDFSLDNSL